jgi:hypothetical protein
MLLGNSLMSKALRTRQSDGSVVKSIVTVYVVFVYSLVNDEQRMAPLTLSRLRKRTMRLDWVQNLVGQAEN